MYLYKFLFILLIINLSFSKAGKTLQSYPEPDHFTIHQLKTDDSFTVRRGNWHQVINKSDEPCHIIEIQYGEETTEDDIERLEYYDGEK